MKLPLLLVVLLVVPDHLAGQWRDPAPGEGSMSAVAPHLEWSVEPGGRSPSVLPVFAAATAGSLVGVGVGFYLGAVSFHDATGCCGGGDDPGLVSGLVGALAASTLLSATGARLAQSPSRPVPFRSALLGSTVGIVTGAAAAYIGGHLADAPGFLIGYSAGQALATTWFATRR